MLEDLMRRNIDRLNHLADRALPHEFAGVDGCLHLKQLAVHNRVDALGFGDGLAHLRQLFERRHSRLVREKVLAALHGAHGDSGALAGYLRGENQLHRGVVEDLVLRRDDLHVGIPLAKGRELVLFAAPCSHQFSASALNSADHAVDVVVAHAAHGKLDVILRRGFGLAGGLRRRNRVFNDSRRSAAQSHRALGKTGHHRRRPQRTHQPSLL
jgi:hypothetical protein